MIENISKNQKTAQLEEIEKLYELNLCLPESSVFIKEDSYQGKKFWAIYDIEGNRLAVTENRECALVLARQNDFIPNSVH